MTNFKMAFMARRFFSSSAGLRNLMKHTVATPAPLGRGALLETAELQQLAQKAKGSWANLSKEEVVQLYRAQFPQTFKEMKSAPSDYRIVVPAVLIGCVFAAWLADTLKRTVGPELPPTFKNAEWEAASREKLLKQKANPISGISSKAHA